MTIEGITAVVDSGLARVLRFDAALSLNRLDIERIFKRLGRAVPGVPGGLARAFVCGFGPNVSSTAPGEVETPEIQRVDLSGAALQLLCWGERRWRAFPWFDPPPAAAIDQAHELLARLGAVDGRGVTALGRRMNRLPGAAADRPFARRGARTGPPPSARPCWQRCCPSEIHFCVRAVATARAELSHGSDSDVLDRLHALEQIASSRRGQTRRNAADRSRRRPLLCRARDQLVRLLEQDPPSANEPVADADEACCEPCWRQFRIGWPGVGSRAAVAA